VRPFLLTAMTSSSLYLLFVIVLALIIVFNVLRVDNEYSVPQKQPAFLMQCSIAPHLPLITSRIEFALSTAAGGRPVITPRIDFGEEWGLPMGTMEIDPRTPTESLEDVDEDLRSIDADDGEEMAIRQLNNSKIPKPQGEPGRPNCGGYSIETELRGWSPDLLESVTVCQCKALVFLLLTARLPAVGKE